MGSRATVGALRVGAAGLVMIAVRSQAYGPFEGSFRLERVK